MIDMELIDYGLPRTPKMRNTETQNLAYFDRSPLQANCGLLLGLHLKTLI